jgi:hypothetical protein
MSGAWKILGWALALIGAVVVVRKTAPWVAKQIREHDRKRLREERALPSAPEPHLLPSGAPRSGTGPRMVDCGAGGSPAPAGSAPTEGLQSSPLFRWCYVVRSGDTAGSIAEAITGDTARYVELLVANPIVSKRGKMGVVIGPDAWDFAEGALSEGTKILVSQTLNAWIDQTGVAQGGYLPYPPDPRAIREVEAPAVHAASTSGDFPPPPDMSDDAPMHSADSTTGASWSDGFDYLGGV